jgi:hypothetical protein
MQQHRHRLSLPPAPPQQPPPPPRHHHMAARHRSAIHHHHPAVAATSGRNREKGDEREIEGARTHTRTHTEREPGAGRRLDPLPPGKDCRPPSQGCSCRLSRRGRRCRPLLRGRIRWCPSGGISAAPAGMELLSVRKVVPTLTSTSAEIYLSMAGAKQLGDTRFILVPAEVVRLVGVCSRHYIALHRGACRGALQARRERRGLQVPGV